MRDYASCGHHGSVADHNIGKDDASWPDKCALLDPDSLRLLEMSNDRHPHADEAVIADGNKVGAGSVNDGVIADQRIFSDLHTARPMQPHPQRSRARRKESQKLQRAVDDAAQQILALLKSVMAQKTHSETHLTVLDSREEFLVDRDVLFAFPVKKEYAVRGRGGIKSLPRKIGFLVSEGRCQFDLITEAQK